MKNGKTKILGLLAASARGRRQVAALPPVQNLLLPYLPVASFGRQVAAANTASYHINKTIARCVRRLGLAGLDIKV